MTSRHERLKVEPLLQHLHEVHGVQLAGYKRETINRRVQRRMQAVRADSLGDYIDYLRAEPGEFSALMNALLINVTAFFRDRDAWDALRGKGLPHALSAKGPGEAIRVWVAGCSTGEEAYSAAMTLAEYLGTERFSEQVKIYATDVDEPALDRARRAVFSEKALATLPEGLRERYLEPVGGGQLRQEAEYMFRRELRRQLIFGRHDLMQDAPISKLDLLICRNTLIYMTPDAQQSILNGFSYALNPNGILFMGKAEMLLTHTDLFKPIDGKLRLFSRVPERTAPPPIRAAVSSAPVSTSNSRQHIRDLALRHAAATVIVVDRAMQPLFVNEQARRQFGLQIDPAKRNLTDLLFPQHAQTLQAAVHVAYQHRKPANLTAEIAQPDGTHKTMSVNVQPLADGTTVVGALVTILDTTRQMELEAALLQSQQEVERSKEELQSTTEVLETTNEELQSTNEELQSTVEELETTNEELQSANEELETTNEELQATNAQLEGMNADQQALINSLHDLTAYHEAILSCLQDGVVVLDKDYRIRQWNKQAEELWGLRSAEAVGQTFLGLDIGLPVGELATPLRNAMQHEHIERLTLIGHNRRGKEIRCAVTCCPLRYGAGPTIGAILTMEV